MSAINDQAPPRRRNPLTWIAIVVVGLILFVFLGGDRQNDHRDGRVVPGKVEEIRVVEETGSSEGTIERSVILPPGMRAREYIKRVRTDGKPYPLAQIYERAQDFRHEGSLADAHLLYFFAARENHLPAIIFMAQLSDPMLFRAENSLLDQADAIQSFKWYSKAAELGEPGAIESIDKLRQWAQEAAAAGSPEARQLLLNIK
jgi:hypothetical protein